MTKDISHVYVDWVKIEAGMLEEEPKKEVYILIVLSCNDSFVWLERMNDSNPLTLLFAAMRAFQAFLEVHHIEIQHVTTDKKPTLYIATHRKIHPFERLLIETRIKHEVKEIMPERMVKFEQMLHTSLLEEGPYCNKDDFETYLVDFMSYYNHPDITQLFPENEVLTDLDVNEEAISEKLEQLIGNMEYEYEQEAAEEETLKITKQNGQIADDVAIYDEDEISMSDLSADLGFNLDADEPIDENKKQKGKTKKSSASKKKHTAAVWRINEETARKKIEKARPKKKRRKKKKEFDLIF